MAHDCMDVFVTRLRDLMAEKEISEISQFAKLSGIPRTTINSWFRYKTRPQIDTLLKLAKFFDCSTDYLLGAENDY